MILSDRCDSRISNGRVDDSYELVLAIVLPRADTASSLGAQTSLGVFFIFDGILESATLSYEILFRVLRSNSNGFLRGTERGKMSRRVKITTRRTDTRGRVPKNSSNVILPPSASEPRRSTDSLCNLGKLRSVFKT